MANRKLIGVLALQGDVREHLRTLQTLDVDVQEVKTPSQLASVDALVIPGGESTTMTLGIEREGLAEPLRAFHAAGRPIFGTLIALVVDGWPVLGLIDQPVLGERWLGATGQPTLLNGQPVRTRNCRELAEATLATTGPHYFNDHDGEHFMGLAAKTDHRRMVMGGDCYNYALLATGHVDIVCEANLKLHDYAALVPVVEGAGGTMCDWNGDPLHAASSGHVLALGDPARLDDVVEALACHH